MDSRIRAVYPHRLNKVFSLKFPGGYLDRQTPEEVQRAQWLKQHVTITKMRTITQMKIITPHPRNFRPFSKLVFIILCRDDLKEDSGRKDKFM